MGARFTNSALLFVSASLAVTGVYGLITPLSGLTMDIHRVSAWMLVLLTPWKALISYRSLRRGPGAALDRNVILAASVALALATIFVVVGAMGWMWRLGPDRFRLFGYEDTGIAWHWIFGLAAIPALALHAWRRWPSPKKSDLISRRGFLRATGLGAAGVLVWRAGKSIASIRAGHAPTSLTGARSGGSLTGNDFPVTTGAGDGQTPLDISEWRLKVSGHVARPLSLPYHELARIPAQAWPARLDCTIGWYTDQIWRGPTLDDLLTRAGVLPGSVSIRLRAWAGPAQSFPLAGAPRILLATHVGDEPLSHAHGFPVRAVAPDYRGWFWIKWLDRIEVIARRDL